MRAATATVVSVAAFGLGQVLEFAKAQITGFTLVDTNTNDAIRSLFDNDTVVSGTQQTPTPLTIQAETEGGVSQVVFSLDSEVTRSDTVSPFFAGPESNGDPDPFVALFDTTGQRVLTASAFDISGSPIGNSVSITLTIVGSLPTDVLSVSAGPNGTVNGELKKWHKVTVGFTGPDTSESNDDNPFLNYRLNVVFGHPSSGTEYIVPGYYACDGDAANTGAASGKLWLVHFRPPMTGTWTYIARFHKGPQAAVNTTVGEMTSFHGASGSFVVTATDKTGIDLRGKGLLEYVGEHHLRFAETGEYFLKAGADR